MPNGLLLSQESIRVACIGDSITYGYGLINRENSYPALLDRSLPESYAVRNFGVSGACAGVGFPDSYGSTGMAGQIRRWNPHIILILLGSNDSKPEYWKNRDFFIRGFHNILAPLLQEDTRVYVLLPPPAGINPFGIRGAVIREEIRPALREYARSHGYGVIDFQDEMEGRVRHYLDNVHPSRRGYESMVGKIIQAMDIARMREMVGLF